MAQPGWYPDPSAPDGKRYWDGSAWVDPSPQMSKLKPRYLVIGAIVLVVVLIVAMLLRPESSLPLASSPEDTRVASNRETPWNELRPTKTPSPTPVVTGFGKSIDCPTSNTAPYSRVENRKISSGHLSFIAPQGNGWVKQPSYVEWMYDYNSMIRQIAPGWISNVGVGYILVSDGFSENPATAAEQFLSCMSSSGMFTGFTKRESVINEDYTVSGQIGWRTLSKVYVAGREDTGIQGDEVNVVIIPTETAGKLAVYVSCATINHSQNLAEVQAAFDTLTYS